MNEREKLIKELNKTCLVYVPGNGSRYSDEKLADFIIADRKRIVEPLVEFKERTHKLFGISGWIRVDNLIRKAIDETLKNAGEL